MRRTTVIALLAVMVVLAGACAKKTSGTEASTADSSTSSTTTTTKADASTTSTTEAEPVPTTEPPAVAADDPGKAAFLAAGEAICAEMNRQSAALETQVSDPAATPAQIADALDGSGAIIRVAIDGLRALDQPAGDEAMLAAMYAEVDALVVLATELASAVRSLDRASITTLATELEMNTAEVNDDFIEYGLTECGK